MAATILPTYQPLEGLTTQIENSPLATGESTFQVTAQAVADAVAPAAGRER